MRKLLTLLFTISGLSVATMGHAANGVVDMTWGVTCTPIVTDIVPTAGPVSMIVSELGNDQTHNAYQVRFLIASAARTIPDAWEFDAAGCQGTAFITINHLPPATASKTCPAFQGATASIQIKDYSFLSNNPEYPSTEARGVCANTYPAGATSLPGTRYFLAQFIFDHTFSVTGPGTPGTDCGGFETPMCLALLTGDRTGRPEGSTSYLRLADGVEVPFDSGNTFLTVGGSPGCPATPVENKTWGQIKSQYRN
jgi:hypothetical protein